MTSQRAADETNGSRSRAVLAQAFVPRFDHLGMVGQPKVIVRAEDNDFAVPFQVRRRAQRTGQVLELLELPRVGQAAEQFSPTRFEVSVRHDFISDLNSWRTKLLVVGLEPRR